MIFRVQDEIKNINRLRNGNIAFSYKLATISNTQNFFIIPAIVLSFIAGTVMFNLENKYNYIILTTFILLFLLLLLIIQWPVHVDNLNLKKEKEIVNNLLDEVIKRDVRYFGLEVKEIERDYITISSDTINGEYQRSLYVLLNNGIELRYHIINPRKNLFDRSLEIDTHFSEA